MDRWMGSERITKGKHESAFSSVLCSLVCPGQSVEMVKRIWVYGQVRSGRVGLGWLAVCLQWLYVAKLDILLVHLLVYPRGEDASLLFILLLLFTHVFSSGRGGIGIQSTDFVLDWLVDWFID